MTDPVNDTDIAIVGMAIRVADASTPDQFWANLGAGHESVRHYTDEELLAKMIFRKEMEDSARQQGWHVVDTWEIVQRYRADEKSLFAGMALYVDHAHWSPRGIEHIADTVAAPDGNALR